LIVELLQLNAIGNLKEKNKKLETEKQQYTKVLNEIKKMEEEKKLLMTRIEVINQLKQSSSLTVHVLDEVASLTPPSRMWLKSLSQVESQLGLTGMALDDQTVAKYMDDLEGSEYIQGVRLARSAMEIYAERNLKTFSITAQVAMPKN
jgi:type IV pilus assembly protein PilN